MAASASQTDQYSVAVGQLRSTTQWLIAAFAAVGAALLAGVQLTSLGQLHNTRLAGAIIALGVGVLAVAGAIWSASQVLLPSGYSDQDLLKSDDMRALRERVANDRSLLRAQASDLKALVENSAAARDAAQAAYVHSLELLEQERAPADAAPQLAAQQAAEAAADNASRVANAMAAQYDPTLQGLRGLGGYMHVRELFLTARTRMFVAAVVTACAVGVFVDLATPPASPTAPVFPTPPAITATTTVRLELTPAGKSVIRAAEGRRCPLGQLRAVVLSGRSVAPEILTLPQRGCPALRLQLPSALGVTIHR